MVHYLSQGKIPRKRHVVFKEGEQLLREEVFGSDGFTGRYSILYHKKPPARISSIKGWREVQINEWKGVGYRNHHLKTFELHKVQDPFTGRLPLMFNDDVVISYAWAENTEGGFYRNSAYDEVYYIQEGKGILKSVFGSIDYEEGDYLVIPRGTTYNLEFKGEIKALIIEAKKAEIPRNMRNEYGQLIEGSFFYHRDIRTPRLETVNERGNFLIIVKASDGYEYAETDYHPFDVVGWDGYLYPFAVNVSDLEPITGKIHQPPTRYLTLEGPNYMIGTFVPRLLDYHPQAIPVPYYHENIDADEVIFYSSGNFFSRKGISQGSITLHRGGFIHGPQSGVIEESIGKKATEEIAVMVETYRRLKLTNYAREIDDVNYPLSWSK
jgi:homogentisate 1,2-dioxygenase